MNDGQPTFLSINGQSVIDLCICYGNFINQYKCSLTTDEDTELFTGAPSRGHLPVLVSLVESRSGYFKEKPWIEKAMWDDWRAHLETEILDWTTSDNALEMWEFFKNSLREATLLFIPFKKVTQHSKPFWCTELTIASKELRQLRRNFRYKCNYANLEKLAEAKELFKQLLSEKASAWMKDYLKALGHERGKEFWVSYKKLFDGSSSQVDLIKNKHGKLLLSKKDIAQEFQETFFEGNYLETLNFDESMSRTVSGYLDSFDDASEHVSEVFHEPYTMEELNGAMKQSSDTNSFDPDGFHVKMIKNLGVNAKTLLLEIFKTCWEHAVWPWSLSRIVFIRKPNKDRYDECSSYRPLSISSHFGKLFERMLCNRLNYFTGTEKILADEQEGFRSKRNTVRSLYRLHLNLENSKLMKTPTALLNIDLEKAFDSVWIDGPLYKLRHYKINGKMFFLKNREAFIELSDFRSSMFKIDIGVPQGSVLSPLLFVIFLNNFLSVEPCHYKFADDSAILIQGCNENDTSQKLEQSCRGIEQ